VRTLAREFGVSPATAAKALNQLAALGLVEAVPASG
jgi:DNA-binding GntR family transcriptional regulator